MIRDKNKVYGELNDPNTVIAEPASLTDKKYVVGNGGKTVKSFQPGPNRILYTNPITGKIDGFHFNIPNRLIGTDSSGKLSLLERNPLPPTPPSGRVLVTYVRGSTTPAGSIGQTTIQLEANTWYEVEVIGAGGGGGASSSPSTGAGNWGTYGGEGGYYKGTFAILSPIMATLQAGSSGGGGGGETVTRTTSGYNRTGSKQGGDGGRSPVPNTPPYGGDGDNASQVTTNTTKYGGSGVSGGANGGRAQLTNIGSHDINPVVGAGGGGAKGPYGGAGGSAITTGWAGGGAGGGAGAGVLGQGGSGGNYIIASITHYGGTGYGAGGGGGHGGGGGGGSSRFTAGPIDIICGGGGGGASGGTGQGSLYTSASSTPGQPGGNNQNSDLGGGGSSGVPGSTVADTAISVGGFAIRRGYNGGRGSVRIWKCVES